MACLAPRAGQEETGHDDDQHDEVGVVLHVHEAIAEVGEIQIQEWKEVPARLQKVVARQRQKHEREAEDHSVETDAGPFAECVKPGFRKQYRRRIRGRCFLRPRSGFQRRLRQPCLREHVARVVQDDLGSVHVGNRVGAVGFALLNTAEQRHAGIVEVLSRHVGNGYGGHDDDRTTDDEVLDPIGNGQEGGINRRGAFKHGSPEGAPHPHYQSPYQC